MAFLLTAKFGAGLQKSAVLRFLSFSFLFVRASLPHFLPRRKETETPRNVATGHLRPFTANLARTSCHITIPL